MTQPGALDDAIHALEGGDVAGALLALRVLRDAAPVAGEGLREALDRDQANTDIDLRDLLRHTYAALAAPVAGGLDVERRSTDAAFGALGAVGDDLQKCIERSEVYRTGLAETVVRANTAEMHRDRAWQNLDLAHEDIAAMLRASGLGDHARPISTHDVIQNELLPWIVRAALAASQPVAEEGG